MCRRASCKDSLRRNSEHGGDEDKIRRRSDEREQAMNFTLTGFVVLLLIAGICGVIGRVMGGDMPGGFLTSIAVGFLGALLGTVMAHSLRLPQWWTVTVDQHPFPVVWAIIGAALFVAVIHVGRFSHRHA
jgi:uncharacterized membrane protein YeaQ/YmgE (transglycosylase-associated protein family)